MIDHELSCYIVGRQNVLAEAGRHSRVYKLDECSSQEYSKLLLGYAIKDFAAELYDKALKAREKYGFNPLGWASPDWEGKLREGIAKHLQKGDPRDVAVYALFAYFHGWSTATPAGSLLQERPKNDGASLIAAERLEQVMKHGWDLSRDADYRLGELVQAATTCLSIYSAAPMASIVVDGHHNTHAMWPWQSEFGMQFYFKIAAKSAVDKLKVAGALIAAEIDRLQGTQPAASQPLELLGVPPKTIEVLGQAATLLNAHLADSAAGNAPDHLPILNWLNDYEDLFPREDPGFEMSDHAIQHWFGKDALAAAPPSTIGGSGGWISVDERLPNAEYWSESVLTLWNKGNMTVQPFYNSGDVHMPYLHHAGRFLDETPYEEEGQAYVTHWQPLPAAPTPSQKAQ